MLFDLEDSDDNPYDYCGKLKPPRVKDLDDSYEEVITDYQNCYIVSNLKMKKFVKKKDLNNQQKTLEQEQKPQDDDQITQNQQYSMFYHYPAHTPVVQKQKEFDPQQWNISLFEIGRPLGKGQFGRVYLARHRATKFILALKIIGKKKVEQYNSQNYIRSELEIMCNLKHKYIIGFYGYFWDEKNIYIMLEYANGGELFGDMKNYKGGRYDEVTASKYVGQLAECLKYCHKNNVIHRDIKPENLLLIDDQIRLTDFGYSAHTPSDARKTRCGTLDYFPFEMASKQSYDHTVDIWSLGVLAYEFCSGSPPFESKQQEDTLNKIRHLNYQFPSHFSIELIDFIKNTIVKDKTKRLTLDQILRHKWIKPNRSSQ